MTKTSISETHNSRVFDDLVAELDSVASENKHGESDNTALQAKILAATVSLSQDVPSELEASASQLNLMRKLAAIFKTGSKSLIPNNKSFYALASAVMLGLGIFILMPSEISNPNSGSMVVLEEKVGTKLVVAGSAESAPIQTYTEIAALEADFTFEELWLAEDELLFSDPI